MYIYTYIYIYIYLYIYIYISAHNLGRLITKMLLTKTTCLINFYKIVAHNGVKTCHLKVQILIKYIKTIKCMAKSITKKKVKFFACNIKIYMLNLQ